MSIWNVDLDLIFFDSDLDALVDWAVCSKLKVWQVFNLNVIETLLLNAGGNSVCNQVHVFDSFRPYRFQGNHFFTTKLENNEFGCPYQLINILLTPLISYRVFVDVELLVIVFADLKVCAPESVDSPHLILTQLCIHFQSEFVNRNEDFR